MLPTLADRLVVRYVDVLTTLFCSLNFSSITSYMLTFYLAYDCTNINDYYVRKGGRVHSSQVQALRRKFNLTSSMKLFLPANDIISAY